LDESGVKAASQIRRRWVIDVSGGATDNLYGGQNCREGISVLEYGCGMVAKCTSRGGDGVLRVGDKELEARQRM
jgi:hypothetical protein